jgi:hypothetical protein
MSTTLTAALSVLLRVDRTAEFSATEIEPVSEAVPLEAVEVDSTRSNTSVSDEDGLAPPERPEPSMTDRASESVAAIARK